MSRRPAFESIIPHLSFLDKARRADYTRRLTRLGEVADEYWSSASPAAQKEIEEGFDELPTLIRDAKDALGNAGPALGELVVTVALATIDVLEGLVRDNLEAPAMKPTEGLVFAEKIGNIAGELVGRKPRLPIRTDDGSKAFQAFCGGYERYVDGERSPGFSISMGTTWTHLSGFVFDSGENILQLAEVLSDKEGADYGEFVARSVVGHPRAMLESLSSFSRENPIPRQSSRAFPDWLEKMEDLCVTLATPPPPPRRPGMGL